MDAIFAGGQFLSFYQDVFGIKNEDGTWRERPNLTAKIFFLKCHGKPRGWVEREERVVTGSEGGPVKILVEYVKIKNGASENKD